MNIRKSLAIMAVMGVCLLWAGSSFASTYYVRDGGGNPSQCKGTTNAVYPGSGSGLACAFNHPRYAIGWDIDNPQAGVMVGGDTLYIDGDSDIRQGQQAQYLIGYDDSGANGTPDCSSSYPYDCTLNNIPAGPSALARTSIIGTGTHKPQLWGNERIWQVLNADNNHVWIQNLEITDHQACAFNDPSSGCNYNGPYPYGHWAEDGLNIGGDDVNVTDVYIHGLGRYGVNTDNFGSATFTRLYVVGNGFGGFTTGINATVSGTLTFNQPIIEWNGCVESYPVTSIDNPSNYSQCFGQNSGGYGDGLAFGNVGHGGAGNWTIIGPGSISFNTQDGFDTLHGNGTGTIQVDKMRFEGNAGNQVKMNAINASLTNSVVIADCGWWYGAPQSYSGFSYGDICRALGDAVLFNVTNNSVANIYNNTIVSNGNIALESEDLNGTGCNSSSSIIVKNNIVLGGYAWFDDTAFNSSGGNVQTTYTYNDGSGGDGAGTCGNLTWVEDYNIVYGTKNNNRGCNGTHDQCGTNPGFASTIPIGTAGGAANTYYQGNSGEALVSLSSSSAAISSALTGLSYWNNGKDYHNVIRTNPPSKGSLEKSSCAANTFGCLYNSDCCSGTCTNFVCGTMNTTPQPVVTITNPQNGSNFTAGSNVFITVTASEANGTISNISLYDAAGILLGSSNTSPFNYTATNSPAGTYTYTALATDAHGLSVASNPVQVIIEPVSILPSLPVVAITSPANGSTFSYGSNVTIASTASETNGTISKIYIYNGAGILLGTGSTSPYNYAATDLLAGTYTFTAQAKDSNGISVTSSPITITVKAPPSPPVVALTGPVNGSSFNADSNVTITATASETNGIISKVTFYNGSNLLWIDNSSPYTYIWDNVAAGTYSLTAVATDSAGAMVTSSKISITVNPHVPPTVSLTSPINNASYTAPASIVLTANATATNATISKVAFYNGTTLLSTDTSSPYSYTWNNVAAGTYNLDAVVTDSTGTSVTSSVVNLIVTIPYTGPTVDLTSPINNSSFTIPAGILLTASAVDKGASISRIDYYAGSIYLGEATSSPFALNWTSAQAGTYSLTAKATDSAGNTFYSSPANITVNPHTSPAVSLTTPVNNATYAGPANIVLTANTSAGGGTITKVDFYNGTFYLGTVYNSPYILTWNNVPTGTYSLTAKTTDSYGWSAVSSAIKVTVNG